LTGTVLALTVGLPASGKSTWALSAGFDRNISLDDCRKALWGARSVQDGSGGIPALLLAQKALIAAAMARGRSIVVHNTSHLKCHRMPLVEMARRAGYASRIVYFDVPLEECLRRNRLRSPEERVPEAVIREYAEKLEVPERGEADEVLFYLEILGQ